MKTSRVLVLALMVALLSLSGLSMVVAQDALAPVDLTIWHQESEEGTQQQLQALFDQWAEARSPGSTAEFVYLETEEMRQQLLTAGLAGSGLPHVIMGPNDALGVYDAAGLLQPLQDALDTTRFTPGSIEAATLNGNVLGIPYMAGNHLMLMWNTELVDEAPETWEDLIATAQQIQEENPDVQGLVFNMGEPFWLVPFVAGFGGSVFDAEGNFTIDQQGWVDAFQFLADLKFEHNIVPAECDIDCVNGLFQNGDAAFAINGDWAIGTYNDPEASPGLAGNLAVGPMPMLENGQRPMPYVAGRYFAVPVTTEGDELAAVVDFIDWITSDEAAVRATSVEMGRLPAVTAGTEMTELQEDPLLMGSTAAMQAGTGFPANVELRCMWDAVRPQFQGVLSETVTAADAAADAQAAAEECLETLE